MYDKFKVFVMLVVISHLHEMKQLHLFLHDRCCILVHRGVRTSAVRESTGNVDTVLDRPLSSASAVSSWQEDILSIWNRTSNDQMTTSRIRDTLRRVLNLPTNTIMEYKTHNDSLRYTMWPTHRPLETSVEGSDQAGASVTASYKRGQRLEQQQMNDVFGKSSHRRKNTFWFV